MRFKNLDLNLLAALDILLTERSVGRSAIRMNITQSAMSNALARLRRHFGDELLVPVGRQMRLTARAEQLRDPIRDVLARIETAVDANPSFDPRADVRTFRLLASDYTMATIVHRLIANVEREGFAIDFEIRQQTDQPSRMLEMGETDLLIIPRNYASNEHPTELLFEEQFVCVADRDHPRIRGATLTMEDFCRERHAVLQPQMAMPSFETIAIEALGIRRNIGVRSFSHLSLPHLVIGTELLATVHLRLARHLEGMLPIQLLPLPFVLPSMPQSMQWHRYRSVDPAMIWLRKQLLILATGDD